MAKGLSFLVNLGTAGTIPSLEVRQVRLTNATALVAIASAVLYDILDLFLAPESAVVEALVTAAFVAVYGLVLLLNARGHAQGAKVLHVATTWIALAVATLFVAGTAPGLPYYYFVFAVLPPLIWSERHWPWIVGSLVLTLAAFLYVEAFPPQNSLTGRIPEQFLPWFRFPAVIASLVTVAAVVMVSQFQMERRESTLEGQRSEIVEQNRWKDRLFGIIAHDLRNPFTALDTSLDVLVRNYPTMTDRERLDWLKLLHDSSSRTSTLLEGLLVWARDLMLSSQPNPQNFRLDDALAEELASVSPLVEAKAIALTWQRQPEAHVCADLQMVKVIVRNLLTNAVKFTPNGGRITVTSEPRGSARHLVKITDTGVGISPHRLSSLFDSDRRQTTRGTQQEAGTGLGLILCRDFVRKNGGELVLESVVGQGTSVCFDLPRGT